MADARLTNLLDHCAALDADTSAEQVERTRQFAEIIAQSLPIASYNGGLQNISDHPDPVDRLIWRLALGTYNMADALSRLHIRDRDGDKWAREYHESASAEWYAARKEVEMAVYGKIRSTTLLAIATG
jgi:hypothetical protein